MRNLYKYVRIYSGALPIFDEGDIFRLTVPLDAEHSPEATDTPTSTRKTAEKGGKKSVMKSGMKGGMESGMKDGASGMKTADAIIALMRADPQITHDILAARLGKARNSIIKQIAKLKKNGLIRRVGPDKGGHWEVIG